MKQIVKHLVRDPSPWGIDENENPYVAYACQYEDGSFVRNPDIAHFLGNGTVMLIPCRSCEAELRSQILRPILIESTKVVMRQDAREEIRKAVADALMEQKL